MLDVGCGWGSFAIHAAERHGVRVVGITLSEPQAELARKRVAERGLADRVEIRVQDYRETRRRPVRRRVEHRHGRARRLEPDRRVRAPARAAREAGRTRAQPRDRSPARGRARGTAPFTQRYVFPDGAPLHLSRIQFALERAGLETHHVEGFRDDYAETLRHWARRFDDNLDEAIRLGGAERARVWRLYLRGARRGFETRLHVALPGALLASYLSAAVRSSLAPIIPPRFGWTGAAAFTGTTGSTQRITGNLQASWPMLAVYQSSSCGAVRRGLRCDHGVQLLLLRAHVRHVAVGDRHLRPAARSLVGQDRGVVHGDDARPRRALMDALDHGGHLRRRGLDPLRDLVAAVVHVAVLARRALVACRVRAVARDARRSRCRSRRSGR